MFNSIFTCPDIDSGVFEQCFRTHRVICTLESCDISQNLYDGNKNMNNEEK